MCGRLHDGLRWSELDVAVSHRNHSLLSNHLLFYVWKLRFSFPTDHLGTSRKKRDFVSGGARRGRPSSGLPAPQLRLTFCGGRGHAARMWGGGGELSGDGGDGFKCVSVVMALELRRHPRLQRLKVNSRWNGVTDH